MFDKIKEKQNWYLITTGTSRQRKKRCFDGYISTPVDLILFPSGPVLEPGGILFANRIWQCCYSLQTAHEVENRCLWWLVKKIISHVQAFFMLYSEQIEQGKYEQIPDTQAEASICLFVWCFLSQVKHQVIRCRSPPDLFFIFEILRKMEDKPMAKPGRLPDFQKMYPEASKEELNC